MLSAARESLEFVDIELFVSFNWFYEGNHFQFNLPSLALKNLLFLSFPSRRAT